MKNLLMCLLATIIFLVPADARSDDPTPKEISKWKTLAQQGNDAAQFNLGLTYSKGKVVSQDYTKAKKWYKLSAEQGNTAAQLNLGNMYAALARASTKTTKKP